MLIDATHDEETRVAIVDDNRLEEYEYENCSRKPLKGSIFLAKVTRVEPSLQAAFVNFGGNRHGFLPFSEIHPDYFRIPISDREALMAEQDALLAEAEAKEEIEDSEENTVTENTENNVEDHNDIIDELGGENSSTSEINTELNSTQKTNENSVASVDNLIDDTQEDDDINGNIITNLEEDIDGNKERKNDKSNNRYNKDGRSRSSSNYSSRNRNDRERSARSNNAERYSKSEQSAEQRFRSNLRRKYKIQEVIKRGQIMLIQVSKEERGNKGAAVGSYLSLPGRYCVLMPNSPRAGGVSRKIANYKDRARMRDLMKKLEIPKGMSVILRTAGVTRTKAEIKRDLDYLMRLWDNIRELTLQSSAPSLVYEEANLIKRAVRDLYARDIEDIHVSGANGYKIAKDFMKMMIPSHVKKIKEYKHEQENIPLFERYKVEGQIAEISETQVTLPSGGYLVINPTEALVSIDVNSGKATKERHIEETALKTNLETATEVARQLRLRDLGGLIVIDFIDMENRRNNAKVERKMRDALSGDRARIQMGRISSFGLMELSRQRLNPSLAESQSEVCKHCNGTGRVRTSDATAIIVLRGIEEEGIKGRAAQLIIHVSNDVAQYILNSKRKNLTDLESRYNLTVLIRADDSVGGDGFRIEVSKPSNKAAKSTNKDSDKTPKDQENKEQVQRRPRRRGRRGGRRRTSHDEIEQTNSTTNVSEQKADSETKKSKKEPIKNLEDNSKKREGKPAKTKDADNSNIIENKKEQVKTSQEKSVVKTPIKKTVKKKASKISNDDAPSSASQHEIVNEPPKEKKRGWWNKLTD